MEPGQATALKRRLGSDGPLVCIHPGRSLVLQLQLRPVLTGAHMSHVPGQSPPIPSGVWKNRELITSIFFVRIMPVMHKEMKGVWGRGGCARFCINREVFQHEKSSPATTSATVCTQSNSFTLSRELTAQELRICFLQSRTPCAAFIEPLLSGVLDSRSSP